MDGEFNAYLGRFRAAIPDGRIFSPLLEFIPVDYRAFQSGEDLIRAMVQILSRRGLRAAGTGLSKQEYVYSDELWLHETVFYAIDTGKRPLAARICEMAIFPNGNNRLRRSSIATSSC